MDAGEIVKNLRRGSKDTILLGWLRASINAAADYIEKKEKDGAAGGAELEKVKAELAEKNEELGEVRTELRITKKKLAQSESRPAPAPAGGGEGG